MASLNSNNQTITFYGVGAHHQNGIVEWRIHTVNKISRTILLHAKRYWPECVDTMLWPFAVKAAIEILNFHQLSLDGNTPSVKLYNIKVWVFPSKSNWRKFNLSMAVSVVLGPVKLISLAVKIAEKPWSQSWPMEIRLRLPQAGNTLDWQARLTLTTNSTTLTSKASSHRPTHT